VVSSLAWGAVQAPTATHVQAPTATIRAGERALSAVQLPLTFKHQLRLFAQVMLTVGQYIGELALLKDEPRAATVTAVTSCTLMVLDRHSFTQVFGGLSEHLETNARPPAPHVSAPHASARTINFLHDVTRNVTCNFFTKTKACRVFFLLFNVNLQTKLHYTAED